MATKIGASAVRYGGKLLFAAGLLAIAFHMTGLPVRPPAVGVVHPVRRAHPVAPAAVIPISTEASEQPFVVKRILAINGPLDHGDWAWDDKGIPAGPIVITIDLAAQTLSVFRNGYEIGTAVIMYGAGDKPTPLGTFSVTEKDAHHVSNIYDAPMPYMLRLTDDGVTIHGSNVEWGGATHGCIGVPTRFAALLFAQSRLGDQVIITNGKMLHVGEPLSGA
jgi:hypothetical protein